MSYSRSIGVTAGIVLVAAMVMMPINPILVAAQCSDGSGCNCEQCGADGYSWWCQDTNVCYSTYETCDWTIAGDCSNCVQTSQCVPQAACNATAVAACSASETCCIDGDTYEPFCAPGAGVTCCNYQQMVCPKRMTCNPPTGTCVVPDVNSSSCTVCQEVIKQLETKGCDEACSFLPTPFNAACSELMNSAGLCAYITGLIQGGETPRRICEMISACGGGDCDCGWCTPSMFGQWCLSLPNECPTGMHASQESKTKAAARAHEREHKKLTVEFMRKTWRAPKQPLMASQKKKSGDLHGDQFCLDGMCAAEYAGCCLTCAP